MLTYKTYKMKNFQRKFSDEAVSLFYSELFTLVRMTSENPYQRIKSESSSDKRDFIVVVTETLLSSKGSNQCRETAMYTQEASYFTLPKYGKHVFHSTVVFI